MNDFELYQIKKGRSETITKITDDVIESISKVKVFEGNSGIENELNNIVYERHKQLLKYSKNKNNSREVGMLWRINYPNDCIISRGTLNSVNLLQNEDARSMLNDIRNIRGLIIIHNHPKNVPFSENDLNCFCVYDTIYAMTAICNDGKIHMLRKEPNFSKESTLFLFSENAKNKWMDFSGITSIMQNSKKLGLTYRCSVRRR